MPKIGDQAQVADAGSAQAGEVDSPLSSFTPADTTGSPPLNPAASIPDELFLSDGPFNQPRNQRRVLTERVLLHIYGPNGPGLGESEEICLHRVNEWLRSKNKAGVSRATLRRAKRELRALLRSERS
jgi:hypothetical protein